MGVSTKRVQTGVTNLYYKRLITDSSEELLYQEPPIRVPGLVKIDLDVGSNIDTLYADNKATTVVTNLGSIEVTIEKDNFPNDLLSVLLGRPKVGAVNYIVNENRPPYVAIMFEQTFSNGKSRFIMLAKGKFMEGDTSNESTTDSVNFQSDELVGRFVSTNYEYSFSGGKKDGVLMYSVDEDSSAYTGGGPFWFDEGVIVILNAGEFGEEPAEYEIINCGEFGETPETVYNGGTF